LHVSNQSDKSTQKFTIDPLKAMKNTSLNLKVAPRQNVIGMSAGAAVTTQVCATLEARELPDDDQRAPVDILVALDVSASMSGNKVKLCQSTLELLLRQLTSNDSFGLVAFSDDATIEIPITKLTASARTAALRKVKSLVTRCSTNISAGIGLAAQELQSMNVKNEVRSIFLLTDGHANRGVVNPDDMCELARNCLNVPNCPPISMHCFGYGTNHDAGLLRTLSSCTQGGTYYFVQDDSAVTGAFGDALGGILSVVAQNTVLNIQVPSTAREAGVKILEVYHDNKVRIDDWNFKVSLGDFYAEESRDTLFQITLSNCDLTSAHVNVTVSYMDTIEKALVTSGEEPCHIARPEGNSISAPSAHVEVQWFRVNAVQDMKRANDLASQGNLEEAKRSIETSLEQAQNHAYTSHPMICQLKTDLDEVKSGLRSVSIYDRVGVKNMHSTMLSHAQQRCTRSAGDQASNHYRSSKKSMMGRKFM